MDDIKILFNLFESTKYKRCINDSNMHFYIAIKLHNYFWITWKYFEAKNFYNFMLISLFFPPFKATEDGLISESIDVSKIFFSQSNCLVVVAFSK